MQTPQQRFIIDFFGLTVEDARTTNPELFQWIHDRVLPHRRENKRKVYREKWWIFAEPRPRLREAIYGLKRYIGTPYTAKHRPFVLVDASTLPDAMVYTIASDDTFHLGVLSSRIHLLWSRHSGGTLEDRPRYNSKDTFLPFPFPSCDGSLRERIGKLGEQLDAHRKRQQALHPDLTMTGMYNVLEKLRAAEVSGKALAAGSSAPDYTPPTPAAGA